MICFKCGKKITSPRDFVEFLDTTHYNGFNNDDCVYKTLCKDCCDENYINKHTCLSCLTIYYRDEDIDEHTHYCYRCKSKSLINSYTYKPYPLFFKNNEGDLTIGLELEINGAASYKALYDSCEEIKYLFKTFRKNSIVDFAYIKRDGSIGSFGCELVSYPATLEYHKNKVPWETFFKKTFLNGRKNCGLHFHVDKNYLSPLQQKLLDNMINNSIEFISSISGRKPNRYCYQNNSKNFNQLGRSDSRYEMVNFNNNNTIEFRFFKSPKTYKNFVVRLEFTDAFVNFIKGFNALKIKKMIEENTIRKGVFWNLFVDFAKIHNDKYKHLVRYFNSNKKIKEVLDNYNKLDVA